MINTKNVLKKICFALFLLFIAGLAIGHYSGLWPRLRIFWYLDSQIPAVQAAMKEYLQKKYDENFEVERPEILYDRYGCRLSTKASPADNLDLKFAISTDHYRFRDPFQPQDLFKNFHDSFCGARFYFRQKDYERRLQMFFSKAVPQIEKTVSSEKLTTYIKKIKGFESDFKGLDLFQLIEERSHKEPIYANEKLVPSVYYETIIYTDQEIALEAEAERFSTIFNEHFLRCKTDRFIIAILFYWQNKRSEVESKLKERFWMKFVGQIQGITPDQANEIASVSFRYSHFREALEDDHKDGKLKNAFIISSYDCQGGPISKEQIIKSFLY